MFVGYLAVWVLAPLGLGSMTVEAQVVERASVTSDGAQSTGTDPDGFVNSDAVISANGRVVGFDSVSANLVPGCTDGTFRAILVRDRLTRRTSCVSVASDGTPANSGGRGGSFNPTVSADGQFVEFQSAATNLVPGADTGVVQIYVHNRVTGTTTLVSTPDGVTPGNDDSGAVGASGMTLSGPARISADGRVVAFGSLASNLAAACTNGIGQIFVRDLTTGATTCVSVGPGGTPGNDLSDVSSLSADGSVVAFDSLATNLASNCNTGLEQVFVRTPVSGPIRCVSLAPDGSPGNEISFFPALSADGRVVVFASFATNLATPCTNFGVAHVFVRDLTTGATTCVTVAPDGVTPANGNSNRIPAVSADGRFVTFNSRATNLVSTPVPSGILQVYVHDRLTGQTTLVSRAADGTVGNGDSFLPSVTGGGGDARLLALGSVANNLVPGDTNGVEDAFVARLAVGPNWLVAGLGAGGAPVRGFDALGNPTPLAFDPGLAGSVHVALGDVNGDGAPDLLVGAGDAPGQAPRVRIFSGSTADTLLADFDANAGAPGGVTVAACDLEGTSRANVITGPGPGGGTQVRVWRFEPATGTVTPLASFPAYTTSPGGVRVACGELDGPDAPSSIITGPGPGSAPLVRVFTVNLATGSATQRLEFLAYPASLTGGVSVAVGDVRRRGRAAIVTGPGPGFPPLVRVWRLLPAAGPGLEGAGEAPQAGEPVGEDASLMAYGQDATGGVNVATGDPTGLGGTSVVTGPGPDPTTLPQINTFDVGGDTPQQTQTVLAGDPTFHSGVAPTAPPATAAAGTPASASTSFTLLVTKTGPGTGTVTATPAGVACGVATCSGSYLAGTVVTLSASPAEGASWEGCDAVAPGTCTVTVTATRFVTATFTGTASPLVAAVLPTSRSVQVGTPATAFATIINTGTSAALQCALAPATSLPATFSFQTTDPATNQLTGTPNTPVAIAAGAAQSFVLALTPTSPIAPTEVAFAFDCTNTAPAASLVGVNTLLLSASATPVPDIIAVAATPGNTGIVEIPGLAGTGVFAVATSNVGATGSITVSADTGSVSLPLQLTLCETNAATGVCLAPPAPTVTVAYAGGSTRSFGLFPQGTGAAIGFDPAVNRVFVRFRDGGGVVRGATSVAVRTQ